MIWIAGIASIALILAILSIHPHELAVLSESINSQQWQSLSYLLMLMALFLCILAHIFKLKLVKAKFRLSESSSSKNSSNSQYLTPSKVLFKHGALNTLARGLGLLLFLCAVISQTLSQRVSFLENSPINTIYVKATVTPIGLSDRRLTISANNGQQKNNRDVVDGYRQLVRLTDIKTDADLVEYEGDKNNQNKVTINPFSNNNHLQEYDGATSNDLLDSEEKNKSYEEATIEDSRPKIGIKEYSQLPDNLTVMLRTYNLEYEWLNEFSPDKTLTMRLKLEPVEVTSDDEAFNEYQWLSTRHATAKAQIVSIDSKEFLHNEQLSFVQKINSIRYQFRQHFLSFTNPIIIELLPELQGFKVNQFKPEADLGKNDSKDKRIEVETNLKNNDNVAVTLSLLTGDRSLISPDMTGLYRFSGISHLLAISGAHVLFLAVLTATFITTLVNTFNPSLYRILPRWQLSFIVAVSVAFLYALFSGFDVPAVRTAVMLGVVGIVRYFLAAPSVYKVLLFIALGMAWQDIFVLWQPGFWLSFIAVVVLVIYSQRWGQRGSKNDRLNKFQNSETSKLKELKGLALSFLKLQLWMSIALLPISLWLFGKVSLWGFIINIFAIGLFGWLIVPLNLLAGLIYPIWSQAANKIWHFIFWLLDNFHNILFALQSTANQTGWLYTDITLAILFLIVIVVIPWVLPKGVWSSYYSLPPMVVLLYLPFINKEDAQNLTQVVLLDTDNKSVSATLISNNNDNWLLLSAYPKGYKNDELMSENVLSDSSQAVYDALKTNGVRRLAGVIVQTATPELAFIVANIRDSMAIDYYWHAGLEHNQSQIDGYLEKIPLTAQSCKVGQFWRLNQTSLTAVSGWPDINDSKVWDCTIMLNSQSNVAIKENNALSKLSKTAFNQNDMSEKSLIETSAIPENKTTSVLFYFSPEKSHAKLWQLMCDSSNDDGIGSIVNKHWVVHDNAYPSTDLVDTMQPSSWHIMSNNKQPTSTKMTEVKLYWQQSYSKRNGGK